MIKTNFIEFWFLPSATIPENTADFYRAFLKPEKISFLRPEEFDNKVCYEIIESFPKSLEQRRNRSYIVIKLKAIIAELGFDYDEKYKNDTYDKENTTIKVIEFVKNNYSRDITMKTLKDEFSISESTINRMFRVGTGLTFSQYLNSRRLKAIKQMLESNPSNLSIRKIAELNGYKTYSTFYRQYLAKYGEPPKLKNNNSRSSSWPLG